MNTRRNLLHTNKLEQFLEWATRNGYRRELTKGDYEVARLRRIDPSGDPPPIIIYRRERAQHLTVFHDGTRLVDEWLTDRCLS